MLNHKNSGESQGVSFQILEEMSGPAGSYKLIFQGKDRPIPKSFSPSTWSREYVMEKIIEACEDAKRTNAPYKSLDGRRHAVLGETKEGLIIRMVFDKQASMITAYPELG